MLVNAASDVFLQRVAVEAALRQFRSIIALINEMHQQHADELNHRCDHLLSACAWIFDASVAVLATTTTADSPIRILSSTGIEDELQGADLSGLVGADRGVLSKLLRDKKPVVALRRHQLFADEAWAMSSAYQALQMLGRDVDGVWCSYSPRPPSSESLVLVLYRIGAEPSRFSAHDAKLLEMLIEGLGWFLNALLPTTPHQNAVQPVEVLAPRLARLLDCLIAGKSEKQAARELGLTRHTVHTYVKELYRTLRVTNRMELFAKATGMNLQSLIRTDNPE